MALTQEERSKTRYHLGFPNIGNATVLALGFPAAGHPAFLLEAAMDQILPVAEPNFRYVLSQCDCTEKQIEELEDLEDTYTYWTDALVDIFGVNKNPFSKKHQRLGGSYVVINPE